MNRRAFHTHDKHRSPFEPPAIDNLRARVGTALMPACDPKKITFGEMRE